MEFTEISSNTLDSILDTEKQPNVSNLLMGIREGKLPTTRSPLFKGETESSIINGWLKILSEVPTVTQRLYAYEESRVSKVGPQGGYPPLSERKESLEDYWTKGQVELRKPTYYDELVEDVRARLFKGITGLRPQSYQTVINTSAEKDSLTSHTGCPDYGKRMDPGIQQRAIHDAESGRWETYPAILGSRSQRGTDRFIFMFAMSCNLVELSFVNVILDLIKKNGVQSFASWKGFTPLVETLDNQRVRDKDQYLSLDYTKMDKHFNGLCTEFVIDVLTPIFQDSSRDLLRQSLEHINHVDVLVEPRKLITGRHGMPSGSGWTNLAESILAFGVILETTKRLGLKLGTDSICQVLGDDGFLGLSLINSEAAIVFSEVASDFNMSANPDKQGDSTDNFNYLQRFFDRDVSFNLEGRNVMAGSYPGILALNTAMNPERIHEPRKWGPDMETLRWIMILENCNEHPAFHQLIEYFMKGDKFKLGLLMPGFLKRGIVDTFKEAKTIKGFVPTFNQEKIDKGIQDFDVVKYLRLKHGSLAQ
jgi:hypothetical protein